MQNREAQGEIGEWGFQRSFDNFCHANISKSDHERPSLSSRVHHQNSTQNEPEMT